MLVSRTESHSPMRERERERVCGMCVCVREIEGGGEISIVQTFTLLKMYRIYNQFVFIEHPISLLEATLLR